jgi:hypothetical protein
VEVGEKSRQRQRSTLLKRCDGEAEEGGSGMGHQVDEAEGGLAASRTEEEGAWPAVGPGRGGAGLAGLGRGCETG